MRRKGPQRDAEKERFWREIIRRQLRSGQSIRGFCRDEALSEPSFYAWRRELKQRDGKRRIGREQCGGPRQGGGSQRSAVCRPPKAKCSAASRPAFVAVKLAAETGQIPIQTGQIPTETGQIAAGAGTMAAGAIELALPSGAVLRLPSGIEPAAVAAIVNAWEQRR